MSLDIELLTSLNQYARAVPEIDVLVAFVTRSYLFKGGVMMSFLWWGWFRSDPEQENHRQAIMSVLMAAFLTLLTARILAMVLPHRVRPMHDMAVTMELPIGMPPMLPGWSSFPSDHAALFGCLACGMFLVSRRAGWLATFYCLLVILLPRVYTGLHYPSDLLAGYGLGALLVWLVSRPLSMGMIVEPVYTWFMQRPGLWYPLFFLISYEIATLFDDLRNLGSLIHIIIERLLQGDTSIARGN